MGDQSVGKSTFIKRYCENRFVSKYLATIGIDYGVKPLTLSSTPILVSFFDLSGALDFLDVRSEFYSDAQGAVLLFDVCSRSSFENMRNWLAEANKYNLPSNCVIHVCGNKVDKSNRKISKEEATNWCKKENLVYFETSASTGKGVNDCFNSLLEKIITN
ncbi:hypothetical protein P9112_014058 [Eukaryota sp. TZLM1-RC]